MTWYVTFFSVGILSFIAGVNWEGQKHDPEDWGKGAFVAIALAALLIIILGGANSGFTF